ncbi:MAG: M48 family metalloprotease [Planctomycetota bacterium]|nr:M48 family metalloprotease [Planctomycetota bacterium]
MIPTHTFRVSLAALLLVLSSACATDRQVIDQASSTHDQLEPAVVTDAEMKGYIQDLGKRIVDVAREMHAQDYGPKAHFKEDADWMFSDQVQFHFVNSTTLNAFTTGGEHMYIYTELLKTCKTEDELVAVMAHEYGHIYGRHVQKGMNRQYYSIGGALAAGIGGYALGGKEHGAEYGMMAAGGTLAALQFVGMGFTRDDEAEADELGFDFYVRAGWDPKRFGDFFQALIDKGLDQKSDTTSDHPTLRSRVAAANARAAKLPPEAAQWRKAPVADAARFGAMKQRAEMVGKSMPNDQSLQQAQTLLAAVASCVSPTDMPEQTAAREKIVKAAEAEQKAQESPKP